MQEFKELVSDYTQYSPAFKKIGMTIVSYGINEPEMFKLLFMQEHNEPSDFKIQLTIWATCILPV